MRTIIFDLDGTLTDPKVGITRSIQHALERLDQPVPSQDELTWCIGPPLLQSLQKLVGNNSAADKALQLYRERFAEIGMFENEPYPGIVETLDELSAAGHRLIVATSKPTVYARPILEHFGLAKSFQAIHGSELDGTRVEKTDLLAWVVSKEKLDARQTVMVGDRSHDIIGAHNNGLATLGVLYGYGTMQELTDAGADDLCEAPADLTNHLAQ